MGKAILLNVEFGPRLLVPKGQIASASGAADVKALSAKFPLSSPTWGWPNSAKAIVLRRSPHEGLRRLKLKTDGAGKGLNSLSL